MFLFTESEKNGFHLLKKTYSFFYSFPQGLIYPLLTIFLNFSVFALLLYGEYSYYGIHIFDPSTLTALLELNFWEHLSHIATILGFMTISSCITFFLRISLAHAITQKLKNQPHSFLKTITFPCKKLFLIFHAGILLVISFFLNFLAFIFITEKLQNLLRILEGEKPKKPSKLNQDQSLLVIPLLIDEDRSIPKTMVLSEQLLIHRFGSKIRLHLSFYTLFLLFFTPITLLLARSLYLHTVFLQALIISAILFFIFLTIFEQALTFFAICTYFYCKKQNPAPFTPEEIAVYFKQPAFTTLHN